MTAVPTLPPSLAPRRGLRLPGLPSWPWRITWTYLTLILFLPLAGMLLKAARVGPAGFWEAATSPANSRGAARREARRRRPGRRNDNDMGRTLSI